MLIDGQCYDEDSTNVRWNFEAFSNWVLMLMQQSGIVIMDLIVSVVAEVKGSFIENLVELLGLQMTVRVFIIIGKESYFLIFKCFLGHFICGVCDSKGCRSYLAAIFRGFPDCSILTTDIEIGSGISYYQSRGRLWVWVADVWSFLFQNLWLFRHTCVMLMLMHWFNCFRFVLLMCDSELLSTYLST